MTTNEKLKLTSRIMELDQEYDNCHLLMDNLVNLKSGTIEEQRISNRLYGDYRGQATSIYSEIKFLKSLMKGRK